MQALSTENGRALIKTLTPWRFFFFFFFFLGGGNYQYPNRYLLNTVWPEKINCVFLAVIFNTLSYIKFIASIPLKVISSKLYWISLFTIMLHQGHFYQYGLTLIPAWKSNYIHHKMWGEFLFPFSNSNSATIEVWEWISYFIPQFTGHVITYPCWD